MIDCIESIRLKGVTKSYRSKGQITKAIDGLDWSCSRGEFCGIEGSSGAGKSTLLALIGCLDRVDSGHLFFNDIDVSGWSYRQLSTLRKKRIGHLYEKNNLISALTIVENLALVVRLTRKLSVREATEVGGAMLRSLGLGGLASRKPRQLSAGELKRASLGRALMMDPELLLLDEPTANLDAQNAEWLVTVIGAFHKKRQGITLVITHDPRFRELTDRRLQVQAGLGIPAE